METIQEREDFSGIEESLATATYFVEFKTGLPDRHNRYMINIVVRYAPTSHPLYVLQQAFSSLSVLGMTDRGTKVNNK